MSPVSSASLRGDGAVARGAGAAVLLVDHLGPAQAAAARRALDGGHDVACLTLAPELADELAPRVRVLGEEAVPGFEEGALLEATFDLVEAAARTLRREHPWTARVFAAFATEEEGDRYLCRSLLRDVGSFLGFLQFAAGELATHERVAVERRWPNGDTYVFLARVARAQATGLPPELAEALPRLSFLVAEIPRRARLVRGGVHAVRQLAALWGSALRLLGPVDSRLPRRSLLLRSYRWDWGFDRGGQRRLRNLDFVVDGRTVRADEVAVWADGPLTDEHRQGLALRGYPVLSEEQTAVGPAGFVVRVLPSLFRATALLRRLAQSERIVVEATLRLFTQRILWGEVARQVRPRALLTLNDLHPESIARTFALRRAGCLTVEYEFSSHWRTDRDGWVPDYVYAFSVVDAMVTWGALHSRHFRNHRGIFGELWEVGCLWSEHARLVREDESVYARYRSLLAEERVDPDAWQGVVGVFDTSLASFFPARDMFAFYAGVVEVARRLPRVLFLCKPKREADGLWSAAPGGADIALALADAPNLVMLPQFFETAAVVGLSDLSINACYTSPAVESIGAGRPALYFDPTGLFPDSFFRRIPRFVAADVDALAALVEEQLALEGDALRADLQARFGELEGFFDGLAVARLRERLRRVLDAR